MRSSDTLPLNSVPNLLVKPGLPVSLPPLGQLHSPEQGAWTRPRLGVGEAGPCWHGAGCHAAPWSSSEVTLVASRLGSLPQHTPTQGVGGRGGVPDGQPQGGEAECPQRPGK